MRRRSRGRRSGSLLMATLAVVLSSMVWDGVTPPPVAAAQRPNIVLITTDDMTRTDLRWMPLTRKLLVDRGANLTMFLSNHPLCCPARAEILTGQYGHNNGVHSNGGDNGGYQALRDKGNHVGRWLQRSGYRTAFVGKHLNHWARTRHRQPGWTIFNPILKGTFTPQGLTMFRDGRPKRYPGVYTADLIGDFTHAYVRRFAASKRPFFIWASHVPPHEMRWKGRWGPPVPPRRYRNVYPEAVPPSLTHPAFNEADVTDKPAWVQARNRVSRTRMIRFHRARIRSLRAVDDQVGRLVRVLRRTGELSNTAIVFTSDNGFQLGEHRAVGKNYPYEASVRVPLAVRGPGIQAGTVSSASYSLVDLAPTFTDLAGARAGRRVDGASMLNTLRGEGEGYTTVLTQAAWRGKQPWWWRGLRSKDHVYVRYAGGFEELYDLAVDPGEERNVAGVPEYQAVLDEQRALLSRLRSCTGSACRILAD